METGSSDEFILERLAHTAFKFYDSPSYREPRLPNPRNDHFPRDNLYKYHVLFCGEKDNGK